MNQSSSFNQHSSVFQELLGLALREDLEPLGDLTTETIIPVRQQGQLHLCARKQGGRFSGSHFAQQVLHLVDPALQVEFQFTDGTAFPAGAELARISGSVRSLLTAERLFLNLLQRAISIASYTERFVQAVRGTNCCILDTRKTTPGLRQLEREAVRHGGGRNHRFNLSSAILIKDNHIAFAGGVREAIRRAKAHSPHLVKIEVEVDDLEQLREAAAEGPDAILLDNFSVEQLAQAVQMIAGRCPLEASGGITLENVAVVAQTGVDFISVGSLTQNPPPIDLGLDFRN